MLLNLVPKMWFHLDCIMQFESTILLIIFVAEKSATTFGDLPDCLANGLLPELRFNIKAVFPGHIMMIWEFLDRAASIYWDDSQLGWSYQLSILTYSQSISFYEYHFNIYASAVITQSNKTLYCIQCCRDWNRTYSEVELTKHAIPRPHGRAMGCLLWGYGWQLTAL